MKTENHGSLERWLLGSWVVEAIVWANHCDGVLGSCSINFRFALGEPDEEH